MGHRTSEPFPLLCSYFRSLQIRREARRRPGVPTGSPDGSSPASTPLPSLPASRNTSRAASPVMPRPASPTTARWEELVRADCTEGDEDDHLEATTLKTHFLIFFSCACTTSSAPSAPLHCGAQVKGTQRLTEHVRECSSLNI